MPKFLKVGRQLTQMLGTLMSIEVCKLFSTYMKGVDDFMWKGQGKDDLALAQRSDLRSHTHNDSYPFEKTTYLGTKNVSPKH